MQRVVATLVILLVLALGGRALRRAYSPPPPGPTPPASTAAPTPPAASPEPRPDSALTTSTTPPAATPEPQAPATQLERGIIGEWTGFPPVPLVEFASKHVPLPPGSICRLPVRLSADRLVYLLLNTHQTTELEGGVFTGTVENISGSTAVMSYFGSAQAGVVLIPSEHRAYNFRAGEDGILRVTELDTLNAPDCGNG